MVFRTWLCLYNVWVVWIWIEFRLYRPPYWLASLWIRSMILSSLFNMERFFIIVICLGYDGILQNMIIYFQLLNVAQILISDAEIKFFIFDLKLRFQSIKFWTQIVFLTVINFGICRFWTCFIFVFDRLKVWNLTTFQTITFFKYVVFNSYSHHLFAFILWHHWIILAGGI